MKKLILKKKKLSRWKYFAFLGAALFAATTLISYPVSAATPSISGSSVPTVTSLTDGSGGLWTVSSGVIYKNGQKAGYSSDVIYLLYLNNTIYQENSAKGFWSWNGSTWVATSDPRIVSANGATSSGSTPLIDSQKNIWTVSSGVVYENGQKAGYSANVIGLTYTNGTIDQENSSQNYWSWNGTTWQPISGRSPASGGLVTPTNTMRPIGTLYSGNGFWEYLPVGYGGSTLSPLMVFWHGIGEDGAGTSEALPAVNAHGPPLLISEGQWPSSRPFVVLSPQHAGTGCPSATEIHNFITFAIGHYQVDPSRVYLTGLSCGALGSADYLAVYGNQQVAASVLISGNAAPIWNSPIWNGQPCKFVDGAGLWSFHGGDDPTVSIAGDNFALPKFIACPQPPRKDVRYTVYPGVGHDAWTQTYDLSSGNDIYTWLLGFTL